MIRVATDQRAHPHDGDLLRYLDRECGPVESADIGGHLDGCGRCSERIQRFSDHSEKFVALLGELEVELPERARERFLTQVAERKRSAHKGLGSRAGLRRLARAAAIALVLLGLALSVTPVRAWLVERWKAIEMLIGGESGLQDGTQGSKASASTVSFVPAGGAFTIDIAAPQGQGALMLIVQEGSQASARVHGAAEAEEILVLPNGLRINNSSISVADYTVTLPSRLTRIHLRIGGSEALAVSTDGLQLPASWSFALRADS